MTVFWLGWLLAGTPLFVGCGEPPSAVVVQGATLDVGCGTCMFKQVGGRGCYWAAKVDGTVYPMKGEALPSEEELPSHGPEGMCTMERQAVVEGQVVAGFLEVERFELLPAAADARKADPHDHEH